MLRFKDPGIVEAYSKHCRKTRQLPAFSPSPKKVLKGHFPGGCYKSALCGEKTWHYLWSESV